MSGEGQKFYGEVHTCNLWANGWDNTLGGAWEKQGKEKKKQGNQLNSVNDVIKQASGPGLNNDERCGIFTDYYKDGFGPKKVEGEFQGYKIYPSKDGVKRAKALHKKLDTICPPNKGPNKDGKTENHDEIGCCLTKEDDGVDEDQNWCITDQNNKAYSTTKKHLKTMNGNKTVYLKDYSFVDGQQTMGTFMNCLDKNTGDQKEICKKLGLRGNDGKNAYYKCGYLHNVTDDKKDKIDKIKNFVKNPSKEALQDIETIFGDENKTYSAGVDLCLPYGKPSVDRPQNVDKDAANQYGFVDNVSDWCYDVVPPKKCNKFKTKDFAGFYSPLKDDDGVKVQPNFVKELVGDASENAINTIIKDNGYFKDKDHTTDVEDWRKKVGTYMQTTPAPDSSFKARSNCNNNSEARCQPGLGPGRPMSVG